MVWLGEGKTILHQIVGRGVGPDAEIRTISFRKEGYLFRRNGMGSLVQSRVCVFAMEPGTVNTCMVQPVTR